MKRILVVLAAGFLIGSLLPVTAWAFGVKDVVAMSQDGIPDSLIIEKIDHGSTRFDLNAKDLHALKAAGVSDRVVVAMLRTEDRNAPDVYYYDAPYWVWPYGPRWYWGLDLNFYGPHYRTGVPFYYGHRFGPGFGDRDFARGHVRSFARGRR